MRQGTCEVKAAVPFASFFKENCVQIAFLGHKQPKKQHVPTRCLLVEGNCKANVVQEVLPQRSCFNHRRSRRQKTSLQFIILATDVFVEDFAILNIANTLS